ncbi:hypothetical protein CO174_02525 [Candidatus Uhrbacteria bacterium CG_4_9_14_3_um_filter_50_9]|uniref:Uncharacterized protein n=1 Tax=Candidatus Uhrbacteria bacterium CG_4_9_14_3_um_filter_50_9 TaxID=1975035 RepID=A0A2M7XCE3_9BACT|nr:MAG: hypothetical protein CO174_02525 [Candidatus Uhrbacteria bacterium CG_4_9_14_3_um_filter_50_9]
MSDILKYIPEGRGEALGRVKEPVRKRLEKKGDIEKELKQYDSIKQEIDGYSLELDTARLRLGVLRRMADTQPVTDALIEKSEEGVRELQGRIKRVEAMLGEVNVRASMLAVEHILLHGDVDGSAELLRDIVREYQESVEQKKAENDQKLEELENSRDEAKSQIQQRTEGILALAEEVSIPTAPKLQPYDIGSLERGDRDYQSQMYSVDDWVGTMSKRIGSSRDIERALTDAERILDIATRPFKVALDIQGPKLDFSIDDILEKKVDQQLDEHLQQVTNERDAHAKTKPTNVLWLRNGAVETWAREENRLDRIVSDTERHVRSQKDWLEEQRRNYNEAQKRLIEYTKRQETLKKFEILSKDLRSSVETYLNTRHDAQYYGNGGYRHQNWAELKGESERVQQMLEALTQDVDHPLYEQAKKDVEAIRASLSEE